MTEREFWAQVPPFENGNYLKKGEDMARKEITTEMFVKQLIEQLERMENKLHAPIKPKYVPVGNPEDGEVELGEIEEEKLNQ